MGKVDDLFAGRGIQPLPLDVLVALALQGQHRRSQTHRVRPGERPSTGWNLPRDPKAKLWRRGEGLLVFSRVPNELDAEPDRSAVERRTRSADRLPEDGADLRVERRSEAFDPDGELSFVTPPKTGGQVLPVQDELDRAGPVPVEGYESADRAELVRGRGRCQSDEGQDAEHRISASPHNPNYGRVGPPGFASSATARSPDGVT